MVVGVLICMSTIMLSKVWPCPLFRVNAYPGVNVYCWQWNLTFFLDEVEIWKLCSVGKSGISPSSNPSNFGNVDLMGLKMICRWVHQHDNSVFNFWLVQFCPVVLYGPGLYWLQLLLFHLPSQLQLGYLSSPLLSYQQWFQFWYKVSKDLPLDQVWQPWSSLPWQVHVILYQLCLSLDIYNKCHMMYMPYSNNFNVH